jgi:hypothetical protein
MTEELAFAKCGCGTLVLTSQGNAGGRGECGSCLYFRLHPMQGPEQAPRHSRGEIRSRMVVGLVALVFLGWISFTVATAPGRSRPALTYTADPA